MQELNIHSVFSFILIATFVIGLCRANITPVYAGAISKTSFRFLCSEWPPFEYQDEDGKPTGFSVELLRAVLNELHIEDNITLYPWKRAYHIALENENTLVFTVARTPERESLFKWVGPIAPREVTLYKLKDRTDIQVRNLDDVKHYVIGTERGWASENQLISEGFVIGENLETVNVKDQNYQKLFAGRIDFIYGIDFTTAFGIRKAGFDFSQLEKSVVLSRGFSYYYAFNKNTSDEIVDKFNAALQKVKDNGTFAVISKKYNWE